MDKDGYPDESELIQIRQWPMMDYLGLMDFVKSLWWAPDWGWIRTQVYGDSVFDISTGGWSGNESLISALQDNQTFWNTCWLSSRRGGHYQFSVPEVLARTPSRTDL